MPVPAQRNFSGGEIAPEFQCRTDVARVQAGLAACRNWLIEKSGSVANRAGFEYRGQTRATGAAWRLVPSVRDLVSTYLLELGNLYCRVWKGGSPVSVAGSPAWDPTLYQPPGSFVTRAGSTWYSIKPLMNSGSITMILSGSGPYTLTASSNIWGPPDAGNAWVLYDPEGNAVWVTLGAYSSPTVFTGCTILKTVLVDPLAAANSLPASLDPTKLAVPVTTWSQPLTPSSGAWWYLLTGNVVEFPTPWADSDLRALQYAQSVDVMTFCHPSYAPQQLRRYSDTRWQMVAVQTEIALAAPTGGAAAPAQSAGTKNYQYLYQITAVDAAGNESDPSASFGTVNIPPESAGAGGFGNFLSWNTVPGALAYNVYRQVSPGSNIYGFIATVSTSPLGPVTGVNITGTAVGTPDSYIVTAQTPAGFSQAQSAGVVAPGAAASATQTLTWSAYANATAYWVYKQSGPLFYLIATLAGNVLTYADSGTAVNPLFPIATGNPNQIGTQDPIIIPDASTHPGVPGSLPLTTRRPSIFASANNYPAAVCYFQQRYVFAQTLNQPEYFWMSQAGNYDSFASSFPGKSTDAIIRQVNGYRINPIRSIIDLGALLLFTDNGIYSCQGGNNGLTNTDINIHRENGIGCEGGVSNLAPVIFDNTALYIQSRGTIVRSVQFDLYTNGYRGGNQSMYSQHLLDGFTIPAWSWAEVPAQTLWMARSDGALLAFTYVPDMIIAGWSRHDTVNGAFEDVCVVPELRSNGNNEDTLYAIVRRVINGVTVRTVERMASRLITDAKLAMFSDSASIYDGRNTGATTLALVTTVLSNPQWDQSETMRLTASVAMFTNAPGTIYVLRDAAGDMVRFTQVGYLSTTVVTGRVDNVVPVGLRTTANTTWSVGVLSVTAAQLAGQAVAVLADGDVIASAQDGLITADGSGNVVLGLIAEVVVFGLPITADVSTLDMETPTTGATISDKVKIVQKIIARVDATSTIQAGQTGDNLTDSPVLTSTYDSPLPVGSTYIDMEIPSSHNRSGSITIRQARPIPARLLSVAAVVTFQAPGG